MENYGIFKHLCTENAYTSLTKTLNSTFITTETQKTIKRITKSNIQYAHMGQLVIKDGICYATFIQNPGDDGEEHDSSTSGIILAVFSLEQAMSENFDAEKDIVYYPIGGKGDICAGYKAKSIFKDNSMCLIGKQLYICFSFITEDDTSHIFCKTFDISTNSWIRESKIVLRYKNQDYDFSDTSLNIIYRDKGLEPRALGLIELVSAWSEYNGEYYATGITIETPNNGFVVKTSDFCTMELVDVIPFNDMGTAEVASYVYKDRLFVACRQDYGIPYIYLGALNLKTMLWEEYSKIPDGNSRPWFFEYKGELYLLHTVEEMERRYTNVSSVRVLDSSYKFYFEQHPIEVMATIKNCGFYYATAEYKGEIYYIATKDTESFGKLCLRFFDEDEVNQKLLNLFA